MTNSPLDFALSERLLSSAASSERDMPHVEEVVGLFNGLRRPLLRYLITFGIGPSHGEEVVQESFVALLKHLAGGKSRANLPAWLFRVCHNLALKHLEQDRGRRNVISDDLDCETWYVDSALNPEEQLVQEQRWHKLQAVLRALPEYDRYCICLRAEGLRYREIAEVLDMSLGAVSMSLTRSLSRFERADREQTR